MIGMQGGHKGNAVRFNSNTVVFLLAVRIQRFHENNARAGLLLRLRAAPTQHIGVRRRLSVGPA